MHARRLLLALTCILARSVGLSRNVLDHARKTDPLAGALRADLDRIEQDALALFAAASTAAPPVARKPQRPRKPKKARVG